MNADERQAIRAKHRVGQNEADDQCQGCFTIPYPCDVIKVLDAWEAENDYWTQIENGTLPEMEVNECDHMTGVMFWTNGARFAYASERLGNKPWTYCPKCGEKL